MNQPHESNRTVDLPSIPPDSLDAGLAAGFAKPVEGAPFHAGRLAMSRAAA